MIDVILTAMPNAEVHRPSIGLGQLKTSLTNSGISAKIVYGNLQYYEFLGPDLYLVTTGSARTEDGLTDWLFGPAAFPDFVTDETEYLDLLFHRNPLLRLRANNKDLRNLMLHARSSTTKFIEWIADGILKENPSIVGCSSTFEQHVSSLSLLRRIKTLAPDTVTLLGGANCEAEMGSSTHKYFPWVDIVVSGEADGLVSQLCSLILTHGPDIQPSQLPVGVFAPHHRANGYPVGGPNGTISRAVTKDINDVPLPDYDDYFEQLKNTLFSSRIVPGLPVESARGCWWGMKSHCTFCGLNGNSMEFRSKLAEKMIKEIDALSSRYQINTLEAVDNIMPVSYVKSFLPLLRESGKDYKMFYETKANLKSKEVKALSEAGVCWIQPGIESLDTRVLKLMKKGAPAWNNVRLLRLLRQNGIRASWTWLFGFPGEKDEWFAETAKWVPWISHLQPGGVTRIRYDRFSPYFNNPKEYGLKLRPALLSSYLYPLSESKRRKLLYFFEDQDTDDTYRSHLAEDGVLLGPGHEALRQIFRAWRNSWLDPSQLPVLEKRRVADKLIISDTRPAAIAAEHHLNGLMADILDRCDEDPVRHQLEKFFVAKGALPEQVSSAIDHLSSLGLIVPIDGRLVGLPLRPPISPMTPSNRFPGGHTL